MRLIFSRKGFDSQYGRVPSPILPDGTMCSLPIPSPSDPHRLGSLSKAGVNLGALAADLTRGRSNAATAVHLDPDLDATLMERPANWRPVFGQIAQAQTHLMNQRVGPGDLFLFFGWFREVTQDGSRWKYVRSARDIHALFGWLQVGEVVSVSGKAEQVRDTHRWLATHPHVAGADHYLSTNNTLYVARDRLRLGPRSTAHAGGGVFGRFEPALQLTAPGRTRSWWQLPHWFAPTNGRPALSYHSAPARWTMAESTTLLRLVDKGQEFVLECDHYPEAIGWLQSIFEMAA